MKNAKLLLFIAVLSLIVFIQAQATVVFHGPDADNPVGANANDEDAWNEGSDNPDSIWIILTAEELIDPTNDRYANVDPARGLVLHRLGEGCKQSGVMQVPTDHVFTDGRIVMEFSMGDDDSVGITLRQQPGEAFDFAWNEFPNNHHPETWGTGYQVTFGYNETASVAIIDIAEGCAIPGCCLNFDCSPDFLFQGRGTDLNGDGQVTDGEEDNHHCDTGLGGPDVPANPDARTLDHVMMFDAGIMVGGVASGALNPGDGRGGIAQTNTNIMRGEIAVEGDNIRVWYGEKGSYDASTDAPLLDWSPRGDDPAYTSGSVGIWQESLGNSIIDFVTIDDDPSGATAVESQDKLSTTWGELKTVK